MGHHCRDSDERQELEAGLAVVWEPELEPGAVVELLVPGHELVAVSGRRVRQDVREGQDGIHRDCHLARLSLPERRAYWPPYRLAPPSGRARFLLSEPIPHRPVPRPIKSGSSTN
ncbi:MAG: hypothetical protein C0478_08905 [Planctomyces sp.]|nr:hypothetical protein [Planctomyces sp.]